jgi:ABC-type multidrug transport system ATPase subunit
MADGTSPSTAADAGALSTSLKKGACVTFQQVAFSLPGKKKSDPPIQILENVTGYFAPGTLTATMGPSGAGKTTFLDIVTGRKNRGKIEGQLLYDGKKATKSFLKTQTAYVEQFDTLLGVLTVRKMLMYQAELKCSRREPLQSKRERVEKILVDLGLSKCADVMIGDALHPGISGGQAKRTNIGIALVTEPRVLFLDEPTSGLDSMTSLDVVTILRHLADQGVTVMSTIHSPTSEAFRLFDSLLLLVKGRTVYFGSLHGDNGAAKYFGTMNITYDPSTNLADFLIRETGDKTDIAFADNWDSSPQAQEANASLDRWVKDLTAKNDGKSVATDNPDFLANNALTAVGVLLKYRTSSNYKFPDFMAPRISPMILFGLIVSSLYAGVGEEAEESPNNVAARGNVAAALFMSTALPSFTAAGYMPSIVAERPLFYRETNDGCYSTFSYVMYKLAEEAIPQIFGTLIFCLLTVFIIEFPGNFFWHWLIFFFTGQTGIALAYCCGAVARNMDEANTLLPIYNVTGMFFTGVLFTYNEIPSGWRWYTWTVFVRYAWSAHMVNNFGEQCEVDASNPVYITPGCPIEYWGIDTGSAGTEVWKNFFALLGFWAFFVGLAWFTMANVRHTTR